MLPIPLFRCEGQLNAPHAPVCERRQDCERYHSLDDKGPLKVQQMMCFDDRYHGFIPVKVAA